MNVTESTDFLSSARKQSNNPFTSRYDLKFEMQEAKRGRNETTVNTSVEGNMNKSLGTTKDI